MNELVKAFRHFIGRDLVFVVTGGAVVATFLYRFNQLPVPFTSWAALVMVGGLGYVVSYALQDSLSIVGLVRTAEVREPKGCLRWLYRRLSGTRWEAIPRDMDLEGERARIADERTIAQLERIIAFKQVGTAGGPSFVACAAILLSAVDRSSQCAIDATAFPLSAGIACLLAGATLIVLGWVKAAQETQFLATRIRGAAQPLAPDVGG